MKNFMKKIGVFGLILALLAPYFTINVKADESECTYHLVNYLFLDFNWFGDLGESKKKNTSWLEGYTDKGYTTFANFIYSIPEGAEILSTEVNNLTGATGKDVSTEVGNFWTLYNLVYSNVGSDLSYDNYSLDQAWRVNGEKGGIFVINSKVSGSNYSSKYLTDSVLLHGAWARLSEDGKPIIDEDGWAAISKGEGRSRSIQTILANKLSENRKNLTDINDFLVEIDPATYISTGKSYNDKFSLYDTRNNANGKVDLTAEYLNNVSKNLDAANDKDQVWFDGNDPYVPMAITRRFGSSDSSLETFLNENNIIFGGTDSKGNYVYTKKSLDTDSYDLSEVNDSYTAWKASKTNEEGNKKYLNNLNLSEDVDFQEGQSYWWPAIFNVEYKTCYNGGSGGITDPEQWGITYDSGVSDNSVTNIPATQYEALGTDITISSDKPKKSGYTFKGWCTDNNGKGKCYNPGDNYPSPDESTLVTLIASWGKTGSADSEKTGVISYVIGFAALGAVAGVIYLINKKKNLFKQI